MDRMLAFSLISECSCFTSLANCGATQPIQPRRGQPRPAHPLRTLAWIDQPHNSHAVRCSLLRCTHASSLDSALRAAALPKPLQTFVEFIECIAHNQKLKRRLTGIQP
jgi:hypothetical protein